jgi:hypothetical protein
MLAQELVGEKYRLVEALDEWAAQRQKDSESL